MLVAEVNVGELSREVLEQDYGGLCGHYLLLGERRMALHRARDQRLGTGFAASRNCFFRELNRGVDWIFSNRAAQLAELRTQLLDNY